MCFPKDLIRKELSVTFLLLCTCIKSKTKEFKVKIKDTRTTSNYQLWTYLTPSPIVFIIDTEHVNARWVNDIYIIYTLYLYDDVTRSSNIKRWEEDVKHFQNLQYRHQHNNSELLSELVFVILNIYLFFGSYKLSMDNNNTLVKQGNTTRTLENRHHMWPWDFLDFRMDTSWLICLNLLNIKKWNQATIP